MTLKCVKYQKGLSQLGQPEDQAHLDEQVRLFKKNPEKYLVELMRFDSAVTSVTETLTSDQTMVLEGLSPRPTPHP